MLTVINWWHLYAVEFDILITSISFICRMKSEHTSSPKDTNLCLMLNDSSFERDSLWKLSVKPDSKTATRHFFSHLFWVLWFTSTIWIYGNLVLHVGLHWQAESLHRDKETKKTTLIFTTYLLIQFPVTFLGSVLPHDNHTM